MKSMPEARRLRSKDNRILTFKLSFFLSFLYLHAVFEKSQTTLERIECKVNHVKKENDVFSFTIKWSSASFPKHGRDAWLASGLCWMGLGGGGSLSLRVSNVHKGWASDRGAQPPQLKAQTLLDRHLPELSEAPLSPIRTRLKKKVRDLTSRMIQYLMEDTHKALSITANLS